MSTSRIAIDRPSAELMRTPLPYPLALQVAWRAMAADFLEQWQDAGCPSLAYGIGHTVNEVKP